MTKDGVSSFITSATHQMKAAVLGTHTPNKLPTTKTPSRPSTVCGVPSIMTIPLHIQLITLQLAPNLSSCSLSSCPSSSQESIQARMRRNTNDIYSVQPRDAGNCAILLWVTFWASCNPQAGLISYCIWDVSGQFCGGCKIQLSRARESNWNRNVG